MATGWIQYDKSLPEKPETLRLIDATGESVEVVVLRLLRFWSWVDDHIEDRNAEVTMDRDATVTDSNAPGLLGFRSIAILARMFGGDDTFWRTMQEVGWLGGIDEGELFIPEFAKRFSQSAKNRVLSAKRQNTLRASRKSNDEVTTHRDKIVTNKTKDDRTEHNIRASDVDVAAHSISWSRVTLDTQKVIEEIGPPKAKGDHSLVFKAAALAQVLSEDFLWDSVAAVKAAYSRGSPPKGSRYAYLFGVLDSKAKDAGQNFKQLLKRIPEPTAKDEP